MYSSSWDSRHGTSGWGTAVDEGCGDEYADITALGPPPWLLLLPLLLSLLPLLVVSTPACQMRLLSCVSCAPTLTGGGEATPRSCSEAPTAIIQG
jgi:hypothetical protein